MYVCVIIFFQKIHASLQGLLIFEYEAYANEVLSFHVCNLSFQTIIFLLFFLLLLLSSGHAFKYSLFKKLFSKIKKDVLKFRHEPDT